MFNRLLIVHRTTIRPLLWVLTLVTVQVDLLTPVGFSIFSKIPGEPLIENPWIPLDLSTRVRLKIALIR